MNCLHVIGSLNVSCGGPSRTVTSLCDALAVNDVHVVLAFQKSRGEPDTDLVLPRDHGVKTQAISSLKLLRGVLTPRYDRRLSALVESNRIDVIHSHGLWQQCNKVAAEVASEKKIPHVISPRGMLEPWAFKHRYWKKMPFWHLWQKNALEKASVLCATSVSEAEGIRNKGFSQPIAIIPNGIDLPEIDTVVRIHMSSVRTALFLSRIHPVKGLLDLVKAWERVRPAGWRCIVAGPDEQGYEATIRKAVTNAGLDELFEFTGPVYDDAKTKLLRAADLFVLPTQSENFGIAIAEALAYGIPVITTKGAPWAELEGYRCGWWVDIGVESLARALKESTELPDEERHEMGRRGNRLVAKNYSWDRIGKEMLSVYEWVLKGGGPPSCVRLQ